MRLQGKIALVTGAASGFGTGIARTFAREGAKIVLMDLNGDGAKSVAASIGNAATAVQGDVTSAPDIARAVQVAVDFGGRLDIVVNNAGWTHRNKPLLEVTGEEFDRVFNVNVRSIFLMTQAAVPVMKGQGGGVILNIGSTAGIRPRPGLTWYNGSKGAVNLLSRSMAAELAPDRIRVNCVAPVIGATNMLEPLMGVPDTPENRAKFLATIPLGRLSRPEDIANACLYLASDEAEFITGVVLEVDGGRTI
ncbi:3-oxoacyl-[acyl-carrier protein] reductase [Azospirillum lipoferum]|uniref:SDR family oxidoreductase n=1 Tax=Azospirillum lipoferum TaxID=193 RepID=A0A5A9GQN5_AZOLI|nr:MULTISPECIES: SDR family oxidoreductase [Azospirillum]KAA0596112.1 SDR family oxidoreductase [Azospirillum lipoferum]MCP1611057.1 3-oxoacyl-[acyl-carrier protein] reductase [Azospirillum lipoferum]MDW5533813.1 SDR family oxidoreductase [Azospirillum sp. NL1]